MARGDTGKASEGIGARSGRNLAMRDEAGNYFHECSLFDSGIN